MTFNIQADDLMNYQQFMSGNEKNSHGMDSNGGYIICEENLNEELVWLMKCRHYSTIRELLSKNEFDPNTEIDFGFMYMTALEFSIVTCDWKMALLFFVNGADPHIKCCDGSLRLSGKQTTDKINADPICSIHPSFQKSESRHLVGFERLRSIIPEDMAMKDNYSFTMMHACVWLMEIADGNIFVCPNRDASMIWNILKQIAADVENTIELSGESTTLFVTCLINVERLIHSTSYEEYENECKNSEQNCLEVEQYDLCEIISYVLRCTVSML